MNIINEHHQIIRCLPIIPSYSRFLVVEGDGVDDNHATFNKRRPPFFLSYKLREYFCSFSYTTTSQDSVISSLISLLICRSWSNRIQTKTCLYKLRLVRKRNHFCNPRTISLLIYPVGN